MPVCPRQGRDRQSRFKRMFMDGIRPTTEAVTGASQDLPAPTVLSLPRSSGGSRQNQSTRQPLQSTSQQASSDGHQDQPISPQSQSIGQFQNSSSSPAVPISLDLVNTANTCYAITTVQVMYEFQFARYLQDDIDPVANNLKNLLLQYLNGSIQDVVPLVNALNMNLLPANQFMVGRQHCAGEFLSSMLSVLNTGQLTSLFELVSECILCGFQDRSNLPASCTNKLLVMAIPHSSNYADLLAIVQLALNREYPMVCQDGTCPGFRNQILSRIEFTEREISIYWLNRNSNQDNQAVKDLTPVLDPDRSNWNGKHCQAIMAHVGRNVNGGHYFPFVKLNGIWWKLASSSSHTPPIMENPFQRQIFPNNVNGNFTIDILFFK